MEQSITIKAIVVIASVAYINNAQADSLAEPHPVPPGDIYKILHEIDATATAKVRKLEKVAERNTAHWYLSQERHSLIYELEQMATDAIAVGDGNKTASIAIAELAELQAIEAIPFLLANIKFYAPYDDMTGLTHSNVVVTRIPDITSDYPCIRALIEIGSPALDPLMKTVEVNDDDAFLRIAAFVLERILNPRAVPKSRVVIVYLNERIELQNDPIRRARLGRLASNLQ